ncbi:MAG: hypothetical protein IJF74_00035 [Clostridia bacterium]|nr:hypothetical protein [Clostridia bacterium]
MRARINCAVTKGAYTHPEKYQNTTLRYTPNKEFCEVYEKEMGKIGICRVFICLDEVWDYRTGEYDFDYLIGYDKYNGKHYYNYDWPSTVPSPFGVHFTEYLTSHSKISEELMFTFRRYEREVTDGIITYEQYEEVIKTVIERCKELAPNIRYIECCNEPELDVFGGLTMRQYYPLYKIACRVVKELNEKHNYEKPLLLGGPGMSWVPVRLNMWKELLTLWAEDDSPDFRLDFYSMHDYHPDHLRMLNFYIAHENIRERLGLPKLPCFYDEFGHDPGTGIKADSLRNGAYNISAMIRASKLDQVYIFPWCTFHNPKVQISLTQYISRDGKYLATPNGHAIKLLTMMDGDCLDIKGDPNFKCEAVKREDGTIFVLCTNPGVQADTFRLELSGIEMSNVSITEYMVDSIKNNCVTGTSEALEPTKQYTESISDKLNINTELEPNGFALWVISPAENA